MTNDDDQVQDRGNLDHSYHDLQQGYSWMDQSSPQSTDASGLMVNVDTSAPSQFPTFSPTHRNSHGNMTYHVSSSPLSSPLSKNVSSTSMFPNPSPRNSVSGPSPRSSIGGHSPRSSIGGPGSSVHSSNYRSNSWSGLDTRQTGVLKTTPQSAFSSFFQISIPSCSTEEDSEGSYSSYKICIQTQFSSIEVQRRYRHFAQLHQGLVDSLQDVPLPPLPDQRRYSSVVETYSSSDRQSLQDYLQTLGSMSRVWQCSRFIEFMDCRHPLLGLQIQFSALKDDCVSYRHENEVLSQKVYSMQDMLSSVAHTVDYLQQQVASLEQQLPQRRVSTPRSQASGSPLSTHTHTHTQGQLAQGRPFHTHGHVDVMQAPGRSAMDDEHHFSAPSRSPTRNHSAPGPKTHVNEFDTVAWPLGQQQISPTPDRRLITPSMRVPGGRKESRLSGTSLTPPSLLGDDYAHSVRESESESAIDEDSFSKFFGLGLDSAIGSTEARLQQLPEMSQTTTAGQAGSHVPDEQHHRHEPEKLNRIASLMNDSGSVISAYLPSDVINSTMMSPSLLHFSNDILQIILPRTDQLLYRYNIEKYISKLVRKSLGAQLYQTGLNSLNCFLPDDPIALSVYLCRGLEHSWYIRLNEKLCRMASGGGAMAEQTEEDDDKPEVESESTTNNNVANPSPSPQPENKIKIMRALSASVESEYSMQPNTGSSSQPITNVKVVSDDVESILQCIVGKTKVNIHANMKIDLCFAAFLEEVDRSIGHNHLFKKSLTLVRAWWIYESPKYADDDLFNPDIIPDSAICIMVCAVFNLHANSVNSPMHALLLFLAEFSEFDWRVYALTIFGRVKRNLIEALPYSSFIQKNGNLFSAPIIQRYQKILHGTSADLFDKVQQSHEMPAPSPKSAIFTLFERIEEHDDAPNSTTENAEYVGSSEIKIYHPLEPNVNVISETILPTSTETFLKIMQGGASRMREILTRSGNPETTMSEDLRSYFTATLNRFESGWRPDTLAGRSDGEEEDEDILLSNSVHSAVNDVDFTGVLGAGENKSPKKPSGPGDTPLGGGTDASDQEFLKEMGDDSLFISLDFLTEKIKHCNFLLEAQVSEPVLQRMSKEILQERGPLPVGEIGKMLQEITKISTLSAYLKEKYGGLKKFLELFEQDFVISVDHPFNPHVFLRHTLQPEDIAAINSGSIPLHLSTKANKRRLSRRKRLTSHGSNSSDVGSAFHGGVSGSGPGERSMSIGYERTNSVTSRSSYTSQQSFGHTTTSSRSVTPTMSNSFYGYGSASGSYSPPDSGNGQIYLGSHSHHHSHHVSHNNNTYGSTVYGDRRRASHMHHEGRADRFMCETDNDYKRPHNRKTIPNQNFSVEYQRDGSQYEGYLDDSGRVRQSSGRHVGPPPNGAYISHEPTQGWR